MGAIVLVGTHDVLVQFRRGGRGTFGLQVFVKSRDVDVVDVRHAPAPARFCMYLFDAFCEILPGGVPACIILGAIQAPLEASLDDSGR